MLRKELLKKVAEYGQRYQVEHLGIYKKGDKSLQGDWYLAILFFFEHSFYQGRRDELSSLFKNRTIEALSEYLGEPNLWIKKLKELHEESWFDNRDKMKDDDNPLQKILQERKVSKGEDRLMVIDSLKFILTLENWNYNIVQWGASLIKEGKTWEVYHTIDNLRSLGDKTTSFFLRDLVSILDLEGEISERNQIYLQPIDTWVRHVTKATGIVSPSASDKKIKHSIIKSCKIADVSPIAFNQGAWYIGAQALNIALESLGVKLKWTAVAKRKSKKALDPNKNPILSLIGIAAVEPFSHKIDQELYGGE